MRAFSGACSGGFPALPCTTCALKRSGTQEPSVELVPLRVFLILFQCIGLDVDNHLREVVGNESLYTLGGIIGLQFTVRSSVQP